MLRSKLLSLGVVAGMAIATAATAAPVTKDFNGLAFNGSSNGRWTLLHDSGFPGNGGGTVRKKLSDSYVTNSNFNLNYSLTWDDNNGNYTDAGALNTGASLNFEQTDFLFDQITDKGVGTIVLRLQASTLDIQAATIGQTGSNATPFGAADPDYALTGDLNFQILDLANNVLMDSLFRLPPAGDLNVGPFNGLAVGDGNGVPAGDLAMFIWAASIGETMDLGSNFWANKNTHLGIDIGMWGQGVAVPAPAGLLLLGFGLAGIAGLRRKAA